MLKTERFKADGLNLDLNNIGWKSYNLIRKKAMEQEFSWTGLWLSMSIAFFVVIVSAQFLSVTYQSFVKENRMQINKRVYRLENVELKNWQSKLIRNENLSETKIEFINKLFAIKPAVAAALEEKGQIEKWTDYLDLKWGEEKSYSFKIKNTGSTIWKKENIYLETGPSLRSFSKFKHDSWLKYYRVTGLSKDIKPGEEATITFYLKAPQEGDGRIQQNFFLVANGEKPISGTTLRLFINLIPPVTTVKKNVVLTNEVKTAAPAIINKPATSTIIDFCVALIGSKDDYENCRTNANENDLSDGKSQASTTLASEPIIRVGLYSTKNAQRLTFNSIYDVYAKNEIILSGVRANEMSAVSYDFKTKQYAVSSASVTRFSPDFLRFIPRDKGGVATLLDFENRTNWNASLNDNTFRNTIEFHYSAKTGNFWVINELPIESYLKGLGETSNLSPLDFQKIIITAARTYAMYHYNRGVEYNVGDGSTKHADEHFHLDSVYDQVYRGYASEQRMPKLARAVNETRGMAITYNNKVVVTPYFSRSDGRTRNWEEVWGGEPKPWCKSVVVKEDEGQTLWGHGVGMSARGALVMVNNNAKWQAVLKYFYQGTELKKIYN